MAPKLKVGIFRLLEERGPRAASKSPNAKPDTGARVSSSKIVGSSFGLPTLGAALATTTDW